MSRNSSLTEGINCDQERVSLLQSENSYLKTKLEKLESENASLKADFCEMQESGTFHQKQTFMQLVVSSDKSCNHDTGIPTIKCLNAIYQFLNPGENVILYNKEAKQTDRGRKR